MVNLYLLGPIGFGRLPVLEDQPLEDAPRAQAVLLHPVPCLEVHPKLAYAGIDPVEANALQDPGEFNPRNTLVQGRIGF